MNFFKLIKDIYKMADVIQLLEKLNAKVDALASQVVTLTNQAIIAPTDLHPVLDAIAEIKTHLVEPDAAPAEAAPADTTSGS